MNDLINLQSLFNNKIFRVPIYQRGYAWTIVQLKDFWEDISNLPNNTFEEKYHYTGMLSIKKVSKEIWSNWNDEKWAIEENSLVPYHIVDGQQRLTTFIIALFEVCKLFEDLEENRGKDKRDIFIGDSSITLYDIEKNYLFIKKPNMIITTYKFGYEQDNPSFNYFINKVLENNLSSEDIETFYTLNLENAKTFFRNNIKALYEEKGSDGVLDFFVKLTQKLVFNVSEIKDGFNEYVAFETINNRGKKLSNLELLKNRLIYLVSLYDNFECPNDEKKNIIDRINNTWKTVYEYLGKNKTAPLNDDDFLMNHWILYFKYNRGKGEAYRDYLLNKCFVVQRVYNKIEINESSIQEFNEVGDNAATMDDDLDTTVDVQEDIKYNSKLRPVDILNYVNSLKDTASIWYKINNPIKIDNSEERKWIDKIGRLGFMYFKPLIAASYLNSNITVEHRINMLKKIERYIFIIFRTTGAISSFGNSEFYGLTNKLYRNEIGLEEIYNAMESRMKDWLFDSNGNYIINSFKNKIDTLFAKRDGYYSWNGLKYTLYEYELYLMERKGMVPKIDWELFVKTARDKVSIEHIYPQHPDKNNNYWNERFNNYTNEQKKFLTNTIGNLLALSQSKNSSLQNDDFDKKKIGYSDGSYSEIEVSRYDEWSANKIYTRGLEFIKFIENRWNIKLANDNDRLKLLDLDFMVINNNISSSEVEVTSQPNDSVEDNYKPDTKSEALNVINTTRLHFWESFINYCKENNTTIEFTKPRDRSYLITKMRGNKCHTAICYYVSDGSISCELYIPDNKKLFELLLRNKEDIEKEIGESLDWQYLDAKKASRIELRKNMNISLDGANSTLVFEWMKKKAEMFKNVFNKYL